MSGRGEGCQSWMEALAVGVVGMLKYTMHTWNILEDCENHKKLTLQCMRIRSCQGKKVLEEWRASMSNSYHASW